MNNSKNNKLSAMINAMKTAIYGAVACMALITAGAKAQNTTKYTIDECVTEALANNLTLKSADNSLAMAKQEKKEAVTKYFPSVSASGGGFIADESLLQMEMAGTSINMMDDGYMVGIMATQPLFMGGQIVNSNKLAGINIDVTRLQRSKKEDEIRLSTETYFWQIVMLKEKIVTLDKMDELLASTLKDIDAAVEAGVRTRNELLQVKLRQNQNRISRINVQNSLSTVTDLLSQIMGHNGEEIDVFYDMSYDLPEAPNSLLVEHTSALKTTDDYNLLEQNIKASELQYKLAVGENLPSVAIGGGYSYFDFTDHGQHAWVGLLTVSVPISDWWGGSHNMKKKKLELSNARYDLQDNSEKLIINMDKTWNSLTDAYKQVEIAMESIEQSTENLRLYTDYYEAGTVSITDLLDAQSLYQQSRDQYAEAFTQYEIKKREYLQATGRH